MNRKSFLKFLILVVGLVIFILVMALPAEATSPGWVIRTVDALGYPHISYYDETLGDVKYATRGEDGWRIQTVDATGDVGKWSSIDVSPFGKPSISYYKALSGDLKYAYQP